jgi:hypothetical protein
MLTLIRRRWYTMNVLSIRGHKNIYVKNLTFLITPQLFVLSHKMLDK